MKNNTYVMRCKCGTNNIYTMQPAPVFLTCCSGCGKAFLCREKVKHA